MNADQAESIFVRNLPFTATITDLEELCGGVGPVKRASIIQSSEGVSRGFGFVKFALPEDAARAAAILNSSDFKGRKIAVELALKRGQKPANAPPAVAGGKQSKAKAKPVATDKAEGEEGTVDQAEQHEEAGSTTIQEKQQKKKEQQSGKDRKRIHSAEETTSNKIKGPRALITTQPSKTLIAFNLAPETTEKQLYKRIKKIETPKSIKRESMGDSQVTILEFENVAAAKKVQKKLDQHIIHGQKLSLRPFHPTADKARGPGAAAARATSAATGDAVTTTTSSSSSSSPLPPSSSRNTDLAHLRGQARRHNRVIVRNLSFKATEADLKEALSAFGPVLEVSIPKVNVRGVEGRRGFGFVTFACAPDAEEAVKQDGGVKVRGREVAVDMCMGKREYQEEKNKEAVAAAAAAAAGAEEKEEEGEEEREEGEDENKSQSEAESDNGEDGEEEEEEEESEEEGEEGEDEDEMEVDEEAASDEEEDEEEEKVTEARAKPSDVKEGKTVFLRNIPFDATQESLTMAFYDYAPVAFAAVVKDRTTGMSKGTAFVKFKTTKGMEVVLGAAAAAGGSLTLMGRDIKVDRAMERTDAPAAKVPGTNNESSSSSSSIKSDRRNLYLANEGLVIDSEAQDTIPKSDLDKRQREQAEKKSKLKNPFFFVSPTRLSIRNIGRAVADHDLKSMLTEAVRKGLSEGKVSPDDLKLHLQAQGLQSKALNPASLEIPTPHRSRDIPIKVKVMRDLDKKPVDGVYPSRGYGFADFSCHAHALAALRHVNNNPAFSSYAISAGGGGGKKSRLIVSFAVENHKALQKKKLRGENVSAAAAPEVLAEQGGKRSSSSSSAHGKRKLEGNDDRGEEEDANANLEGEGGKEVEQAEKKQGRGQRQRERKRQKPAEEVRQQQQKGETKASLASANRRGQQKQQQQQLPHQQQQQQRKQQSNKGKRQEGGGGGGGGDEMDDELAFLANAAAAAGAGTPASKKGKARKETKEDRSFTATVESYKQKLLGDGSTGTAGGVKGAGGKKNAAAERWFD